MSITRLAFIIDTVGICAITFRHPAAFYILRSIRAVTRKDSPVVIITPGSGFADTQRITLSRIRKVVAIRRTGGRR
jgi:hypothetical protein